jgi:hypothetical protein
MRLIKGCITAIGIIGILVIMTLIIGYYLYSLTPSIQTKMTPVAVSADAAQSFDNKLDSLKTEIAAAVEAHEEKSVNLVITEKEINSKIVQILAEGHTPFDMPLKRMLVNFGDGYFITYAIVDVPGVAAKTGAKGRITIVDGEPKLVIDDFNLGKLPLPKAVNKRVEQLLNIIVSLKLTDMPLKITDIQISNHQLSVTGLPKTAK